MSNKQNPAFPTLAEHGINNGMPGMTMREYFAAKATAEDLEQFMPKTIGDVADKLLELGLIEPFTNAGRAYVQRDYAKLKAWAKFQYADIMVEMSNWSKP